MVSILGWNSPFTIGKPHLDKISQEVDGSLVTGSTILLHGLRILGVLTNPLIRSPHLWSQLALPGTLVHIQTHNHNPTSFWHPSPPEATAHAHLAADRFGRKITEKTDPKQMGQPLMATRNRAKRRISEPSTVCLITQHIQDQRLGDS